MMSSMGSTRGNPRGGGGRDKTSSKTSAQTSGKSSAAEHAAPVGKKATADQLRLAQMYSDGANEENTKEMILKCIQKVQDVVPKSEDEVLVALHDSNYDTERAINLLLEQGDTDQGAWETISSKKSKQRGSVSTGFRNNSDLITNNKENGPDKEFGGRDRKDKGKKDRDRFRDKDRDGFRDSGGRDRDGDRERGGFGGGGGRGRGRNNRGQLPPRMTRGHGRDNESNSRDREREKNERSRWDGGESGRGRGRRGYDHMNGPSRRGKGPRSFTNSKFGGNFDNNDAFKPGDNVWTNPPAETENNNARSYRHKAARSDVSPWDNSMVTEDWGAEDWSGDDAALNGQGRTDLTMPASAPSGAAGGVRQPNWMIALTESKVFMASSTPPSTTPITLDSIESQSNAMPPPSSSLTGNSSLNATVSMSPGASLSAGTAGLAPSSGMPPSSMPEMSRGISLAELFAKPASAPGAPGPATGGLGSSNSIGGLGGSNSIGGSTGLAGSTGLGGIGVGSIGTSGIGSTGIGSAGAIGTSSGIGSGGLGNAIGSSAGMGSSSIGDGLGQRPASSSVFSTYVDLKPQAPVSEPSKPSGQVQQLGGAPPESPSATVRVSQLTTNQQPSQQRVPSTAGSKSSKKRLPPPSTKIPASAVEMPGAPARGLRVLDVQFGAMDINMEPSLPSFGDVGSISSSNVPSTSLAVSVSLSSDAYSVSEPSASTASHLSYSGKVSEPSYQAPPSMSNSLMANSTTTATIAPPLDQAARSVYAQNAQNRQMTPDPIPLLTQDLKGTAYMQQTQKPSPTPLDSKPDKQQQLSSTPGSHTTPLSALTSHPSSLASSLSSSGMSASSGGLHSQMGLSSSRPSQSLGSAARQTPNSYHGPTSASIASTVHAGASSVYGSNAPTVSHPSNVYSSVHSSLGVVPSSSGLSSSNLPPSGIPSGQISALSLGNQSGLSSSGQLSNAGQLTSGQLQGGAGSQLTNSLQLTSGTQLTAGGQLPGSSQLAGGSVQLTNSGHPPSSLSGGLNSAGLGGATPSSNSHSTHTSVQTSPLTPGKLGGMDNRIGHQGTTNQHVLDHNHQSSLGPAGLNSLTSHPTAASSSSLATTVASSYTGSAPVTASSLGFSSTTTMNAGLTTMSTTTTTTSTGMRATTMASNTKVPNLPPGMSFVPNQQYIMGHGLPVLNAFPHQPFYNYEDFQMQLSRMPAAAATATMGYPYDLQQFQQPATTLTAARDVSSLSTAPYSVTEPSKFTRGDASSPVAASSLSAQQPTQQPAQHATGSHHTQQAAAAAQQQPAALQFNAAAAVAAATIPPGYGYAAAGGLPYYPAGPAGILPPGLQYPPTAAVFPAVSTVQPTNRSQPATTLHSGFQQSAYGSHGAYGTGYDDLTQTQDFTKSGYSGVSQTQKTATGAAGVGVASRNTVAGTSAASASVGAADISGSSYSSKTHTPSFPDKQSFHGTPSPFSFPLASGTQTGPLNPAAAYPQHFVPMQQHHITAAAAMLPQHLQGDSHASTSQRSQGTTGPAKQTNKQSFASTYWSAN